MWVKLVKHIYINCQSNTQQCMFVFIPKNRKPGKIIWIKELWDAFDRCIVPHLALALLQKKIPKWLRMASNVKWILNTTLVNVTFWSARTPPFFFEGFPYCPLPLSVPPFSIGIQFPATNCELFDWLLVLVHVHVHRNFCSLYCTHTCSQKRI